MENEAITANNGEYLEGLDCVAYILDDFFALLLTNSPSHSIRQSPIL